MNSRTNIYSGSPWEDKVGYSRVLKVGNQIYVAGTVAIDESGNVIDIENYHEQTKFIFQKIEKYLKEAGATLKDVVRT